MPLSSTAEIAAKISLLSSLTFHELRREWSRACGGTPPSSARQDYLARVVAYRMQADLYEGLPTTTVRRLKKLGTDYAVSPNNLPAERSRLTSGTRILREWQGEMHEAIVVGDGFLYNGKTYKSLSVIARKITGTRWSGPLFFGLKKSQAGEREPPNRGSVKRLTASRANSMVAEADHG